MRHSTVGRTTIQAQNTVCRQITSQHLSLVNFGKLTTVYVEIFEQLYLQKLWKLWDIFKKKASKQLNDNDSYIAISLLCFWNLWLLTFFENFSIRKLLRIYTACFSYCDSQVNFYSKPIAQCPTTKGGNEKRRSKRSNCLGYGSHTLV